MFITNINLYSGVRILFIFFSMINKQLFYKDENQIIYYSSYIFQRKFEHVEYNKMFKLIDEYNINPL